MPSVEVSSNHYWHLRIFINDRAEIGQLRSESVVVSREVHTAQDEGSGIGFEEDTHTSWGDILGEL